MEQEKENLEVSEKKEVKIPNANPYSKDYGNVDEETEAFAKGEFKDDKHKFWAKQPTDELGTSDPPADVDQDGTSEQPTDEPRTSESV